METVSPLHEAIPVEGEGFYNQTQFLAPWGAVAGWNMNIE
jgi:hypothetical protein